MMEKLSADEFDINYKNVLERLNAAAVKSGRKAEEITLLAATKTVDADTINYAIQKGITHIGENRVQELLSKQDRIIGAHRHFIGHLQTNKVKDIIDKVEMIESVDSLRLAEEISKQAVKRGIVMNILLEVNIGGEESKGGIAPSELFETAKAVSGLENVRIRGLMTIPPVNCDEKYFASMQELFENSKQKYSFLSGMDTLSMGMSGDYATAVKYGSTLVRIGSGLFGYRNYSKI